MDRRSWSRPGRAIVVVCAVSAPAVLPSAALGAGPVPALDQVQRTVGEAVSQAGDLAKPPAPPVAPAPKTVAPARRASSPARPAAPPAGPAPARQTAQARATASQNSAPATTQDRAAPARSSGTQAAAPSEAPATARPVFATGADIGAADDEAALPFTGSRTLPLLMVAALVLLAGFGLRRAVRTG